MLIQSYASGTHGSPFNSIRIAFLLSVIARRLLFPRGSIECEGWANKIFLFPDPGKDREGVKSPARYGNSDSLLSSEIVPFRKPEISRSRDRLRCGLYGSGDAHVL